MTNICKNCRHYFELVSSTVCFIDDCVIDKDLNSGKCNFFESRSRAIQYKRKAIIVDAFRYGIDKTPIWFSDEIVKGNVLLNGDYCEIYRVNCHCSIGTYIVRLPDGELKTYKQEEFKKRYEKFL